MQLTWGIEPSRHDAGVERGVLYFDSSAVPWNGLIRVSEDDSTEVVSEQYFDGVRSIIVQNLGEYNASIDCYTYPDQLEVSGPFGFSYRVPYADGHKVHLVYNAHIQPSVRVLKTLSDSAEATVLSWTLTATPIPVPGANPVSHLIFDTAERPDVTETIENIIYGTTTTQPRLPSPQELIDICEFGLVLKIQYHGDGSWTASGPDEMLVVYPDGSFDISSPTTHLIDDKKYVVSSY